MPTSIKIGVFDSGLGGLTVLRSCIESVAENKLLQQTPIEFIYLGDNARVPYGSKSPSTIKRYGLECASFLKAKKIDQMIVACNTVSAHALSEINTLMGANVIGTITPAVDVAVATTKTNHIGVIGTAATCASGAYECSLLQVNPGLKVTSVACPLLVPLVEQGMFEGEIVDKIIELYLAPFKESDVDTLILGCTHYPLLQTALEKFLGNSVTLVTCSDAIAKKLLLNLQKDISTHLGNTSGRAPVQFYVTDELSHFNSLAARCLDGIEVVSELAVLS